MATVATPRSPAASRAALSGGPRRASTGSESRGVRILFRAATWLVLAFLYIPLAIVVVYAFNGSIGQTWPPSNFTTRWFGVTFGNAQFRSALWLSIQAALGATVLALVLGSLAAFAVHKFRFFGRQTVSFLLVLPIALPGILTGIALNSAINFAGVPFSLITIIVGHATFCIVVVFNNVVARLRRSSGSIVEASMDLGATAWQTFRIVTLPNIVTALVAGGLLAFALSFDEIIVTIFTAGSQVTLPIFIYDNIRLPRNRPIVNVVAMLVILLSIVPVYLAQRMTRERTSDRVTERPSVLETAE
jgi:putative spermidine/putrescine transport system permease protein